MVALLKQKSKVIIQKRPRKTYEIKNIFKKPKIDPSISKEDKEKVDKTLNFSGHGKTAGKITP